MQNLLVAEVGQQQGRIARRAALLLQGYRKVKGTRQLLAPITPMREIWKKISLLVNEIAARVTLLDSDFCRERCECNKILRLQDEEM